MLGQNQNWTTSKKEREKKEQATFPTTIVIIIHSRCLPSQNIYGQKKQLYDLMPQLVLLNTSSYSIQHFFRGKMYEWTAHVEPFYEWRMFLPFSRRVFVFFQSCCCFLFAHFSPFHLAVVWFWLCAVCWPGFAYVSRFGSISGETTINVALRLFVDKQQQMCAQFASYLFSRYIHYRCGNAILSSLAPARLVLVFPSLSLIIHSCISRAMRNRWHLLRMLFIVINYAPLIARGHLQVSASLKYE